MDRRIATIAVIAVMMALCMSPVFADESDADSTTRVSEAYVYKATAIAEANPEHISSGNISMIFIDGSENDQMMDAYLADPENMSISVIDDDRDALGLLTEDTPINLYRFQSYLRVVTAQTDAADNALCFQFPGIVQHTLIPHGFPVCHRVYIVDHANLHMVCLQPMELVLARLFQLCVADL